jgi:hypothetical protein
VFFPNGTVFGQVTPSLAHDPYRDTLDRLTPTRAQEERFPVHGLGRLGHQNQSAHSS